MKIEIYEDRLGEWRWRARAKNGRVTADGAEGYATKSNVRRAVRRTGGALLLARVVEVKPAHRNGDYRA